MPKVSGLGHVGIFVKDMPMMIDFYTNFMGMYLTDRAPDDRIAFFSARPDEEHHEFALAPARSPEETSNAQQISFTVDSLETLQDFYQRIVERGLPIERTISHGNALACYFRDPEDNVLEVYWNTGIDYPQPHGDPIDLAADPEDLMEYLRNLPPKEPTVPRIWRN